MVSGLVGIVCNRDAERRGHKWTSLLQLNTGTIHYNALCEEKKTICTWQVVILQIQLSSLRLCQSLRSTSVSYLVNYRCGNGWGGRHACYLTGCFDGVFSFWHALLMTALLLCVCVFYARVCVSLFVPGYEICLWLPLTLCIKVGVNFKIFKKHGYKSIRRSHAGLGKNKEKTHAY